LSQPQASTVSVVDQFSRFAVIGVFGFGVDAGVLWLAMYAGAGFDSARLLSFLIAASVTWALNRRHNFRSRDDAGRLAQWLRYVVAMTIGGAVNLGASFACYHAFEVVRTWPVLAVAVGSLAGMMVNFFTARQFVFR
jgi:putative flippase GtrA